MKLLNTKKMKELLEKGVSQVKSKKPPSDGGMISLFTEEASNGWYYQVDYIHDTRVMKHPYVAVYAFRPPRDFSARAADYYLYQEIKE